jgi:hypothetical protein
MHQSAESTEGGAAVIFYNIALKDSRAGEVAKLDPKAMQVTPVAKDDGALPLRNVSVAIEVDVNIWIGPFRANGSATKQNKILI